MREFRVEDKVDYVFCSKTDPADCGRLTLRQYLERGGADGMSDDYVLGTRRDLPTFFRKVSIWHKSADSVRLFCRSFCIDEEFFRMNILLSRAYVVNE